MALIIMYAACVLAAMTWEETMAQTDGSRTPIKRNERHNIPTAFTAHLSTDREISPGSPVVCDNSPINEGGQYFNTSGQFVCIDDAVYVFVWSAQRVGGVHCVSTLRLGPDAVVTGPQTSYYSNEFNSGNSQMTAVVQCRTSPLSSVTVVAALENSPTPVYGAQLTGFSGFKLAEADAAIAFSAELSGDTFVYPGGRLIFDRVSSNFGGYYEGLHGYFRCPDNGVYSFVMSTHCPAPMTSPLEWSVTRLMFDGVTYIQGPMTYVATDSHESGSASLGTVLQCQQGKDVYVEAKKSFEFDSSIFGAGLTSFTGFGLCHDNCSEYVAFTAVLSTNISISDTTVIFDTVLANVGDAYDSLTGQFRCPDNGLYMISWSATSTTGSCYLDLYQGNDLLKSSYLMYQPGSAAMFGTSGTASMSTVTRCSPDSILSLRSSNLSAGKALMADYTSFSGYRIPGQ